MKIFQIKCAAYAICVRHCPITEQSHLFLKTEPSKPSKPSKRVNVKRKGYDFIRLKSH